MAADITTKHCSKFKKKNILSLFSVPHDIFWPDQPQLSGQNKSEAREQEGSGQNNLWYCR